MLHSLDRLGRCPSPQVVAPLPERAILMDTKTCPSPGQLTAFVLGTLDEPQITSIAEHLDLCPTCEQAVAGMEDITDSVVDGLRRRSGEFQALSAEPELPEILGDYRLIRVLGRGGMGVVYEAEQIALGRRVALKVLPQQARLDPRLLSRFRREAQAAARLHHTHIVPVFGVGEADGVPFYVMQLIHGRGLDSVLRTRRSARKVGRDVTPTLVAASDCLGEGRAYWKSVARLGLQVAEALDHAHGEGFLHRDIKPSNLLIDDRASIWVTDFGLVKDLAEVADLTHSGAFLGTLRYAPPEALQGEKADTRGDLYSLGVTLYELATLRPAFEDNDRSRLMHRILHEDPAPPRQIEPALPRDLETIILKTCSREPSRRYQTAAELGADLQRFLDDQPIRARPLGQWGQALRWARRNPAVAGLMTTLLMVLTFGFAAVSTLWLKAENASRHAEARRVEAEQSLDRSEANVYYSRISQADLNYQLGDVSNALLNLSQCVPSGGEVDRRDWEWSHLRARLNAEIASFPGHRTWIFGLAPLADGRLVVGGGEPHFLNADENKPGDLRVWDVGDGKPLARLELPDLYSISAIAASPDGRALVTHDAGGPSRKSTLRLWDLASGKLAWERNDVDIFGGDGTFSADGRRFLAIDLRHTLLLDAATGSTLRTFPRARAARFTESDGHARISLLAAGSEVSVWDPETGKPSRDPNRLPFPDSIEHADFSPDGRWLAVLLHDATMAVWEVASGRRHLSLDDPGDAPSSGAFRPDSRAMAIGYRSGRVRVIDLFDSRGNEAYRGHEAAVQTLAFGPDGSTLASGDWSGTVKVWDLTRSPESLSLYGMKRGLTPSQVFTKVEDFAFLPDSDRVVGFRLPMAELAEWEAGSGVLLRRRRLDVATEAFIPGHLAEFSGDGRACVAADRFTNRLNRFDVATGRPDGAFSGMAGMINRVALNGDGRRVAAVGWKSRRIPQPSSEVAAWDAPGDAPTWRSPLDGELCGGLAISDDGRRLAVSSLVYRAGDASKPFPTCRIRILDGATGRLVRTRDYPWHGGTPPRFPVAFDRSGRLLAFVSTTDDGPRVGLWDVESGDERFQSETSDWPDTLAFSPDGRRLATASHTLVTLWDTQTGRSVLRLPIRDANPGAAYNTRVRFSPDGKTLAATHSQGQIVTWRADDGSIADRNRAAKARRFGWHLGLAFASASPEHASSFDFHVKALERQASGSPYQLAELHALDLRLGRFESADARLDALEGKLPDDPQPWFDHGWSALERGDAPRALRGFAGAASATAQAESITIVHMTMLALMERKDDLALRAAKRGAASWLRSGTIAERYPILVSTLSSPGPLDVAPELPSLTKAILALTKGHRPGEDDLLQSLAQLRAGDTPEAERRARLALTRPLPPSFVPVAHASLALALKARGDLPGARAELDKADAAHDLAHPKTQAQLGDGLYWLLSGALRREARKGL